MVEEIWKDIKDFEGLYMVSSFGRVKGLDRITKHNAEGSTKKWKGAIIKPSVTNYSRVTLNFRGKKVSRLVHRLQAEAFIPNPDNMTEVNHKDGNPYNNLVENLEWVSPLQNSRHYVEKSTHRRGVNIYKKTGMHRARFSYGNTNVTLGYFKTEEEAYKCYYDTYIEFMGKTPWESKLNPDWTNLPTKPYITSKKRGITYVKSRNRYLATLCYEKSKFFLGYFKTKEEAYTSYYDKYLELTGKPPWKE